MAKIAKDFKSNSIRNGWDRWWHYSDFFYNLKDIGNKIFYHSFTGQEQGKRNLLAVLKK